MPVDGLALIHSIGLSIRMVYVNYHRVLKRSDRCYGLDFLPGEFVGFEDRFLVPVSPVHVILESRDAEGVPEIIGRIENRSSAGTVVIAGTYDV